MGLKRKASFEDSSMSSSSPQSLPPSSQSSASTYTPASSADRPLNFWNIAGAPYFNSRTRKRFRDDRPDAETIHQHTLNKLFSAQKNQHNGGPTSPPRDNGTGDKGIEPADVSRDSSTCDAIVGPSNLVEAPTDRNQRRLNAFFSTGLSQHDRSNESPPADHASQRPLPSSIYQPQESVPHLIPPHPRGLPSVLACEDCDAPLLTKNTGEAVDAEMLDVDGSAFMDPEIDQGWSCSICTKRVCDVCAVRGDYRVCLECAVPGGGKYRQEEIQEKRWVGGIGWI